MAFTQAALALGVRSGKIPHLLEGKIISLLHCHTYGSANSYESTMVQAFME